MKEHFYVGTRNTWYNEPVHLCNCGFESHEKAEVEKHVEKEDKALEGAKQVLGRFRPC